MLKYVHRDKKSSFGFRLCFPSASCCHLTMRWWVWKFLLCFTKEQNPQPMAEKMCRFPFDKIWCQVFLSPSPFLSFSLTDGILWCDQRGKTKNILPTTDKICFEIYTKQNAHSSFSIRPSVRPFIYPFARPLGSSPHLFSCLFLENEVLKNAFISLWCIFMDWWIVISLFFLSLSSTFFAF